MGKKRNKNPETPKAGGHLKVDSDASDLESIAYSSVAGDFDQRSTEDEELSDVLLVDSFGEQIENAQDKRVATRQKALENISILLKRVGIMEMVEKWKQTLCDIVEKSLKRTPEEANRACAIAALICLHLGVDVEETITDCISAMRALVLDASASESLRSACAHTIGLCVFLSCEQFSTRFDALLSLKEVWSTMKLTTTQSSLFSAALSSWVLLLERCERGVITTNVEESQRKLCVFLESPSVEVRIASGEALAVLYEIAVSNLDEDFRFYNHNHLQQMLSDLAADSVKYHAKRDKKAQKFTFRQINDAIFAGRSPSMSVKFNKRETLHVDGCHTHKLYDSICHFLKSEVNKHLSSNEVLRGVFDLGSPLQEDEALKTKEEKAERMNFLGQVSKARNIHRAKQRDKKTY